MSNKDSIDVLMTFIVSGTNAVAAESSTILDKAEHHDMIEGFTPGNVFEVDDFTFSANLTSAEDRSGADNASWSGGQEDNFIHARGGPQSHMATPNAARKAAGSSGSSNLFAKYIASGDIHFNVEIPEVTITKQVESSSIPFLKACVQFSKFERAILIKRKFTGKNFHEAFLRLEFKEPLITGVEWDEGEIIREKLKFVCRGITAMYRRQDSHGNLGSPLQTTWSPPRRLAG
jgi:type VI protein secretion system component Hcp